MPKRRSNGASGSGVGKRKRPLTSDPSASDEEVDGAGDSGNSETSLVDQSQNPDFTNIIADEAEVGIVEQITVKNFLCHTFQELKFGPNVNFIVGRNGSGKSAIMTALVVGLGGKANVTNRGSTLKSFIKNGKNSAEIIIKLRNRGADAYKPQLYGESIIVERKINRDASSTYRLKNSQGKVMSLKRDDLQQMLDSFNIQVDNPIVVLNQETSRNFLHSKSPSDKYKFFLKATQLEQIKSDYINANESRRTAIDILENKQLTLPMLEKEVFEWEQKYKALSSLQNLRKKVEDLGSEHVWSIISAKEKTLSHLSKDVHQQEISLPKYVQKVEETQAEVNVAQQALQAAEKEVIDLGNKTKEKTVPYEEARNERDRKKKRTREAHNAVKKIQKEIHDVQRDKDQLEKRINEMKNSEKDKAEIRAREEKIERLNAQKVEVLAQRRSAEQEQEQFTAAVARLLKDVQRANSEKDEEQNLIRKLRQNVQHLEASKGNRLRRFGSYVPALIQKIDEAFRQGRFHQKPRGPIGAAINLRDQKWTLAIENCLKGNMMAFCVHDHHDERELEKIMKEVCTNEKKPSTITSPFQDRIYDVSRNRPQTRKYSTVLEELGITDPVIANCLIDQNKVEKIILIPDKEEARRVMSTNPPNKTEMAFNILGDKMMNKNNSFRYYSNFNDKAKYLVASVEEDIRKLKEELDQQQGALRLSQERYNTALRELETNKTKSKQLTTRIMKLGDAAGKIVMELEELKNFEQPTPADEDALAQEVAHFDEQLVSLEEKLKVKVEENTSAHNDFLAAEEKFSDLDKDIRETSSQIETLKENMTAAEMKLNSATNRKKHFDRKYDEQMEKIRVTTQQRDDLKQEVEGNVAKAEEMYCARIRTKRSPQNLESEIKQIKKQIEAEEKIRGNPEEITTKYRQTQDQYVKIMTDVDQLSVFLREINKGLLNRQAAYKKLVKLTAGIIKSLFASRMWIRRFQGLLNFQHQIKELQLVELNKVMSHRQSQYTVFRRMIATRARFFFVVMLNTRKYAGKMTFDHKKEQLELHVQPTSQETADANKDMRSLSGGERSFSTVCFILSLWDAMESPFRCLDEFDVFMDMVNRRISMDMMLNVAESQLGRQFIFLTPQDLSHVSIDRSLVRIFQMRAPERGQGTLPFQPITNQDQDQDEEEGR